MKLKDYYGTSICVGSEVAFNCAGSVRLGTVEKITPRRQVRYVRDGSSSWMKTLTSIDGKGDPMVSILVTHPSGEKSVVKNIDGIVVFTLTKHVHKLPV